MLKYFLTAHKWSPQSKEEVIAGWNDGKPFRIYQSGGILCSGNDHLKLLMAKVTHVHFVWQEADFQKPLGNYLMEL